MRTLVVFYSRTGNTSLVAEKLAALFGADLERILVSGPQYEGRWGFIRAIFQSLTGRMPSIDNSISPRNYDLIIVGGPIWRGRIAPPVQAYLHRYAGDFKSMAVFVTHGGSSPVLAFQQMEEMSGRGALATLAVTTAQITKGEYDGAVRAFAEMIEHIRAREGRREGNINIKSAAWAAKQRAM